MGQLIQVIYTLPVSCVVDIDEGFISEVVVLDEEMHRDGTFLDAGFNPRALWQRCVR